MLDAGLRGETAGGARLAVRLAVRRHRVGTGR
jgi:hypothetical protein